MSELSTPGFALSRTPRSKLAATVAEQLAREIRTKRLATGTRMPSERDLMAALGVGRSTIREAINGLAMLGVLEIRHGQGAFVLDPEATAGSARGLAVAVARGVTRNLFEARRAVESETARLAALRRTDADLNEIAQTLAEHEAALRTGAPAIEAAVRFHVLIAAAAHNDVLAGFVGSFSTALTERGTALEAQDGYREWELEQHRAVLEPIAAGDAELARERMCAHLDAVVPRHERIGLT